METAIDPTDQLISDIFEAELRSQADPKAKSSRSQAAGKEPVAYYDSLTKNYWSKNTRNHWVCYTEASLKRFLRLVVYKHITEREGKERMIEHHLLNTQRDLDVSYAGCVAGYHDGLQEICGERVLVTRGPAMLLPKKGKWDTLGEFLSDMLGLQCEHFFGWMKIGLNSLMKGPPFVPGQLLALAGPAGCGKSLLQHLITHMLGGRSAKPFRYMTGETNFNADLVCAEHLMIEDEAASTDVRVRRYFGSQLKTMVVNATQRIEGKGLKAINLEPFWRLSISVNDEPENLMVLPPLDESLRDKIMLLQCVTPNFPFSPDSHADRKLFFETITSELPAFVHFLKGWKIPQANINQRFGVKAYAHPDLLDALDGLSPEAKFLALIDTLQPWEPGMNTWTGTANELEEILLAKDKLGRVAKLLSYNTACGTFLARLAKRHRDRVQKLQRHGNKTPWMIEKEKSAPLPL